MKRPTPLHLWAVVVRNPRGYWIHHGTTTRTRRDTKKAWLGDWADPAKAQRIWKSRIRSGAIRVRRVFLCLEGDV